MKDTYSDQEKFISNLLIFVFIFIIVVITVIALHYAGVLNLNNESSDTSPSNSPSNSSTNSIATLPSDFSSSESLHTQSQSSEHTSESTKYQPATIPPYIPSYSVSTQQTTHQTTQESTTEKTTQTTTQTTESSQTTAPEAPPADQPQGITAADITDEKMAELITVKYLSIHPNSRSGDKLKSVKNIVVHYVANKGTTADQNWRNFENNKPGTSAHFIIDLDGSILQCMPLDEVAWAIGTTEGNYTTISIECCHPDSTGKFTDETYESLVKLVSWLCAKFDFDEDNVKRHYDYPRTTSSGLIWHKQCPLYYVNNPDKWEAFKEDLYIA